MQRTMAGAALAAMAVELAEEFGDQPKQRLRLTTAHLAGLPLAGFDRAPKRRRANP